MDLSIRDWMLVVGVLLILAVLLDGYRRVRRAQATKVRLAPKSVPPGSEEELTRGELPNGGARIAPRAAGDWSAVNSATHREPTFGDELAAASASYAHDSFDEADSAGDVAISESTSRPSAASRPPVTRPSAATRPETSIRSDEAVTPPAPVVKQDASRAAHFNESALNEAAMVVASREPVREPASPVRASETVRTPEPAEDRDDHVTSPTAKEGIREIIIVNATSKDPLGFNGEELLHILLTCDLRFGKMNIFHRYEKSNAKGPVQFSVANAVEPGTFDLNNMRNFRTPGICLFMQLPGPQDAHKALEYMVETAQCIARNLNGELRDENRSALTAQTVEHYRNRIREFDRKRMAKHA